MRRVKIEFVDFDNVDPFGVEAVAVYEQHLKQNRERGNIKALLICNPHNPLGKGMNWKTCACAHSMQHRCVLLGGGIVSFDSDGRQVPDPSHQR